MANIDDLVLTGTVNMAGATAVHHLAGSITNAHIGASFSSPVGASKVTHIHKVWTDFGVAADAAPAADTYKIIFRARAACTIRKVSALLLDTGTSADVKFDLRKATAGSESYSTILSATIDFTHADTDNTAKNGTVANASLVAGDVLVAYMDYTSATNMQGPAMFVEIDEPAAES